MHVQLEGVHRSHPTVFSPERERNESCGCVLPVLSGAMDPDLSNDKLQCGAAHY